MNPLSYRFSILYIEIEELAFICHLIMADIVPLICLEFMDEDAAMSPKLHYSRAV